VWINNCTLFVKQFNSTGLQFYGPDRFVVLMDPLHIEGAFLCVIGQSLEGSGWGSVVADSGITSVGCADALLKVCFCPQIIP